MRTSYKCVTRLPVHLGDILQVSVDGESHAPTLPLALTPLKTLTLNFLSFSSLMRPSTSLYDSHSTRLTGALRLRTPGRGGSIAWRGGHMHTYSAGAYAHAYVC